MDLASLPKLVCNLRNLQVLVLSGNTKITTLPSSMGNLKQMRFLDLSDTGIILFPESIGGLSNLQTLNLDNCVNLKMLPKDLSSMRSLKNLLIDRDGAKLTGMPLGIGQLTCLKSLSTFVVSPFSDSAGIQELEMLNHLQGELTIKGLQHVRDPRDAQQANLGSKDSLSSVRLLWIGVDKNSSKEVLERLRPHANVQELFIEGYPGVVLPCWVGSSAALPKLTSLELQFMPNVEGWSFGSLILLLTTPK
ncbi:hypothetical protein IFM89_038483 [Coptis chinensis]|uniref:R13L1/DRL21-like LRR repeat region domain-containing protein n=1 Tax=Coptis chinensis TaxID=261450 RepID=A0A835LPZ9_9MAGN|nr:hypothetical protein IFM89_038483 [Coptis chinensis]